MKKGFGSIHSAAGMKNYLDRKIKSEIDRNKPAMRTATVVSVDRQRRRCEVRYPGEDGTVRVPYGNAEPAGIGSKVKIDGPVGERRIVDVLGKTRTQTRLELLESENSAAPLWGRSTADYAETFPLMWINPTVYDPPTHSNANAHCTPMTIPQDMHISQIEVKLRRKATSNLSTSRVRLALHRVRLDDRDEDDNISFNLQHIATSPELHGDTDVGAATMRMGYTLPNPHQAFAGEVYTVSYATYNGTLTAGTRHPLFEATEHPTIVQTLGANQFARGWYQKNLIVGDVPRELIDTNLTRSIWAAAFPLPPGQGYVDSGGDTGTSD